MVELSPGVTSTPGIKGGCPCVAGTRIPAYIVAWRFALAGESIAEIAADYDLTAEQVENVLRWEGWLRHRAAGKRKLKEAGL